jgi:hypothetical protein
MKFMFRKAILTLTVILIAVGSVHSISSLRTAQNERKNVDRAKPNQTNFSQIKSASNKTAKTKTGEIVKKTEKKNQRSGQTKGKRNRIEERKNQTAKNTSRNLKNKKVLEETSNRASTKDRVLVKNQNSVENRHSSGNQNLASEQNWVRNPTDNFSRRQAPRTFDKQSTVKKEKGYELEKDQTKFAGNFIVKLISEPLRDAPSINARVISKVELGTVLNVFQKNVDWYGVYQSNGLIGWISANTVEAFDKDSAEKIYLQIAEKNYGQNIGFEQASELASFLSRAIRGVRTREIKARLEFLYLLTVRQALRKITSDNKQLAQYKDFLRANEGIIVYNEPNAEWIVISKVFWDLQRKYSDLPIADEIAWEASQNPLPGNCEGDLVCMLFYIRMTKAEYLRLYPNGVKSAKALDELNSLFEEIINMDKKAFYSLNDSNYKVEFSELIAELGTIVARLKLTKKEEVLHRLKEISEKSVKDENYNQ